MSALTIPAREIRAGQEILCTTEPGSPAGVVGAVAPGAGSVYVWFERDGGFTMGAADAVLNHGDRVTLLAPFLFDGEKIARCPSHPDGTVIVVETGYTRFWSASVNADGTVEAFDEKVDVESGAGDDHFECSTCLTVLPHIVDFAEVNWS